MLGVFSTFTLLSAAYLYFDMYRPLSTHYSAVVSIVTDMRETLSIKTLTINAVSFVLIFAGILILGVLYTHRIIGPLHRVKVFAQRAARGELDAELTFRKKDAIQAFGESFNMMTKKQSERKAFLNSEMHHMKEAVARLKELAGEGKSAENEMKEILDSDDRIRRFFSTMKL
jgi:methyl-accepting chemotaxis protein